MKSNCEEKFKRLWTTIERASAIAKEPKTRGQEFLAISQIIEVGKRLKTIKNPVHKTWFENRWGLEILCAQKVLEDKLPWRIKS